MRAIAVLAVIAFHAAPSALPGGFIGVDIFFVISGYLISRNILLAIGSDRFSFADFYLRRARRILPALYFTVLVTFAAGVALLTPEWLRSVSKESTWAVLSISNIEYWWESRQYFAAASEQLGLLHVWSLSAEEQFYLVWPAFLILTQRKLGAHRVPVIVSAIGTLSLIIAIITYAYDPSAAFFLPQCRMFEFCLGVAVLFAERGLAPRVADIFLGGGVLAVLIPFWLFPGEKPIQPALLLVPCAGAALIIFSGDQARLAGFLRAWPLRSIGLISYSLYLCHWPILFFYRLFQPGPIAPAILAALLAFMLAMAAAMYICIEQPFRCRWPVNRRFVTACCVTGLGVAGTAHTAYLRDGWRWRLSEDQLARNELQKFGVAPCQTSGVGCLYGAINEPRAVVILGDSFALQYVAGPDQILKRLNLAGYTAGGIWLSDARWPHQRRGKQVARLRDTTRSRAHPVGR
ncbi:MULTISPECIES: acyltransferase family protein [Bradyrhizobium]|uniref:acyltransferase family protein n=1 Tax=Bradyrhizobium TaxID=374 RepID=UPI000487C3D7|nr:acyltransferase [Bradyrhizobium arachidis]UFW47122.1 acyltransferase [Bradyrhizobium arachidis]